MINILAIRCGLTFAPYILESLNSFLTTGKVNPRVVKQAASGLILRSESDLIIHYQNREDSLSPDAARHYLETVQHRSAVFDIAITSDEVVLANVADMLLLSHPQSEVWLEAAVIPQLLSAFEGETKGAVFPEWLSVSGGDGRLLLSDGRNGRWVLLGTDHFNELKRRQPYLAPCTEKGILEKPPTLQVKGLKIHLQAAFKLKTTFEEFASNANFLPYEEYAPTYSLQVARTTEGMKITDGNLLVTILPKEARKWAAIIEAELEKLSAIELERDYLKTIFAKTPTGCWVLQGGDEILLSNDQLQALQNPSSRETLNDRLIAKRTDKFNSVLDKISGNCVALTHQELEKIRS